MMKTAQSCLSMDPARVRMVLAAAGLGLFMVFFFIGFDTSRRVALIEGQLGGTRLRMDSLDIAVERSVTGAQSLEKRVDGLAKQIEGVPQAVKSASEPLEKQVAEAQQGVTAANEGVKKEAAAVRSELAAVNEGLKKEAEALKADVAAEKAKLKALQDQYGAHSSANQELAGSVIEAHKSLNETRKMIESFHEYIRKSEERANKASKAEGAEDRKHWTDLKVRMMKLEDEAANKGSGASQVFQKVQ